MTRDPSFHDTPFCHTLILLSSKMRDASNCPSHQNRHAYQLAYLYLRLHIAHGVFYSYWFSCFILLSEALFINIRKCYFILL